jgi:hypothetical protein
MSDMTTKLLQHIEEMRGLLTATATHEQSLVKALSDALNQVDNQLAGSIRRVAAEHQARRAEIFNELQALASTMGMFQPPPQEVPYIAAPQNDGQPYFPAVGDWRQATTNMSFEDQVDYHLNGVARANGTSRQH